jgi:hypothetical protein
MPAESHGTVVRPQDTSIETTKPPISSGKSNTHSHVVLPRNHPHYSACCLPPNHVSLVLVLLLPCPLYALASPPTQPKPTVLTKTRTKANNIIPSSTLAGQNCKCQDPSGKGPQWNEYTNRCCHGESDVGPDPRVSCDVGLKEDNHTGSSHIFPVNGGTFVVLWLISNRAYHRC